MPRADELMHAARGATGERAQRWRRERPRLERRFPAQIQEVIGDCPSDASDLALLQAVLDGVDRFRGLAAESQALNC